MIVVVVVLQAAARRRNAPRQTPSSPVKSGVASDLEILEYYYTRVGGSELMGHGMCEFARRGRLTKIKQGPDGLLNGLQRLATVRYRGSVVTMR